MSLEWSQPIQLRKRQSNWQLPQTHDTRCTYRKERQQVKTNLTQAKTNLTHAKTAIRESEDNERETKSKEEELEIEREVEMKGESERD